MGAYAPAEFIVGRLNKEEMMKKVLFGVAIVTVLWLATSVSRAQDSAKGEKTFKAKCAGCHGADAAGKAAVKSPSIKGKTADEITKEITTSPKHTSVKSLPAADVKDIAAYLATLK
jgi:mono/diheme cytochrome c family protein